MLATCSSDHSIRLWEAQIEEEYEEPQFKLNRVLYGILQIFKYVLGHNKWVWDCEFTCDSLYIITGIIFNVCLTFFSVF
jgi:target of rapamycin complex subunit LST8